MNLKYYRYAGLGAMAVLAMGPGVASATILSHHAFSWWDDPVLPGVLVTAKGAPAPTATSIHLLDLDEWHLDVAQTLTWFGGGAVAGAGIVAYAKGELSVTEDVAAARKSCDR